MGRIIKLFLLGVICYLLFVNTVFAETSCQPVYGGGQTCTSSSKITIDKKVLNPKTNLMVDNLEINDPRYQPSFIIVFQIKVTNTGKNTLSKVDIKDIFPQYVSFSAGDGNFDANTKTVSISTPNLKPNETRTFNILGRIVSKDQLPQGVVCVINQAISTNDGTLSQDNAQFCIEAPAPSLQPSPNIQTTPPTGPEALVLFSLIPMGVSGFLLKRIRK